MTPIPAAKARRSGVRLARADWHRVGRVALYEWRVTRSEVRDLFLADLRYSSQVRIWREFPSALPFVNEPRCTLEITSRYGT